MNSFIDLVGSREEGLRERFGEPRARSVDGESAWLVFDLSPGRLRIRCRREQGRSRVASWTLTYDRGQPTLAAAAGAVGLWPAAAPDVTASEVDLPLVRRALPRAGGPIDSLTATVRDGCFSHLSVFDEPPDWL